MPGKKPAFIWHYIKEGQRRNYNMMTVKEVSNITGISKRTLHYYDEIGLLKPAGKNEAGYRLYNNKTLERLQQILFFREFGIPLKVIKNVIENPALDRNQILQTQRKMLISEKERLERLVKSIDKILEGDNNMDFEVFSIAEIEEIFNSMISKMNGKEKALLLENHGGIEGFKKHFIENASSAKTQKNWKKMVEWYGSKENILDHTLNPCSKEVADSFRKRIEIIMNKLAERKKEGYNIESFEVKELIGEYGFVQKQLFGIEHEEDFMLGMAELYQNNVQIKNECDKQYGGGMAGFFAEAVKEFYK